MCFQALMQEGDGARRGKVTAIAGGVVLDQPIEARRQDGLAGADPAGGSGGMRGTGAGRSHLSYIIYINKHFTRSPGRQYTQSIYSLQKACKLIVKYNLMMYIAVHYTQSSGQIAAMKTPLFKLLLVAGLVAASFTKAVAGTQYIASLTSFHYNATDTILMEGGQTVTIDDGTGWVTAGRIRNTSAVSVKYSSTRSALFLGNSLMSFSGGYVSDGYLYGSVQNLYYGSTESGIFNANSHITFSGGYVSTGYLDSSSSWHPYGSGTVQINVAARADFKPGPAGTGVLAKAVLASATFLSYGPSRIANFRASGVFTSFLNNYVSNGVLDQATWLTTSSGIVNVPASTICNFSGGYYVP